MTQLAAFNSAAFATASGLAIAPGAAIEVRRMSDGALASIFADEAGASPIAQPGFTADANGRFVFYAPGINHGYSVKATIGADTYTISNVAIGLAAQLDASGIGPSLMQAANGPAAAMLLAGGVVSRATNTMLGSADMGKTILATASFTQTLDAVATLANGWWVDYIVGSGVTTIFDPNLAETIDGAATITVVGPASLRIKCSGSDLRTMLAVRKQPTRQVFTSGSGTYTTPTGATRIFVRLVGAGGGGGGGGGSGASLGTAGGNTTFGSLTAGGGGRGNTGGATFTGGAGGTVTGCDLNQTGTKGGDTNSSASSGVRSGYTGGATVFGGAIQGLADSGQAAQNAPANTGAGGHGGGGANGVAVAAGGGSGGYGEKLITAPAATYSYAVGAGGSGGAAGTSGSAGAAGGSGLIIVEEFYD